jgi:hypothetical protein
VPTQFAVGGIATQPGYGVADVILQGLGGWFAFGLHDFLSSKTRSNPFPPDGRKGCAWWRWVVRSPKMSRAWAISSIWGYSMRLAGSMPGVIGPIIGR